MEDKNSNRLKFAMTIGAIIGLGLVVFYVLLYLIGLYSNSTLGLFQWVFLCTGIYIGTKNYRDKELGGYISYGKALIFGLIVSVFAGIIIVFFNFVLMKYIDPGLVDKIMVIVEEKFQNGRLSRLIPPDQIDATLEKTRASLTSVWSLPWNLIVFSFFGFIISLVTSAFLKKDPNPFVQM